MGELIALLDSATGHLDGATGLTAAYPAYNAAWCDAENPIDFVTVTSDVYRASGVLRGRGGRVVGELRG